MLTNFNRRATKGDVILVGGDLADTNKAVWARIVEAGGGVQSNFGVLTAGSIPKSQDPNASDPEKCSNSECNGDYYVNLLKQNGAGSAQWIPIDLDHQTAAEDVQLAARVRSYTGFFIGGGDQTRYSEILIRTDNKTDTAVLAAMRAAISSGAGVAGSSAGAAIQQAGPMVTGGESYYGVRDGAEPGYSKDANKLTYRPEGGFGFFTAGLADTHFGVRGREGRFIRLLSDTKSPLGFGLDEDTALISTGNTLTVLGTNNVHMLSLKDASVVGSGDWGINTVRWTMLGSGDSIDLSSGKITPASGTSPYRGESQQVSLQSTDVFSSPDHSDSSGNRAKSYEMIQLAQDLVNSRESDSTSGETYEESPLFTVTLSIGKSYSAWKGNAKKISFQDIVVDIAGA